MVSALYESVTAGNAPDIGTVQFAPQQRLYLRPLPHGHGSFRSTFFLPCLPALLGGCRLAFQKSYMSLIA